eukprot:scaffold92939_cov34-Phaeocystis_antarctica.AAC.1
MLQHGELMWRLVERREGSPHARSGHGFGVGYLQDSSKRSTPSVGKRQPRVACHGLQLHARSAIVPKTGCRGIGPRLTLKSGSVEAARVLLRHALEADAMPHVTALGEGAL